MTEKEKAAKLKKQQKLQDKKKLALEEKNAKLMKKKAKQDKKNAKLQKEKDKKQAKQNKERDQLLKLKEEEKDNLDKLAVKEKVKQQKLEEKAKIKKAKLDAKQKEKAKKQGKKNKEDLSDEELKKQRLANRNSKQTFNALDNDDDDDNNDENTEDKTKKDKNSIIITIILGLIASISLLNVLVNTVQHRNSDGYFKIDEVLTTVGSDKNYMKIGIALGGVNKDINKLDAGTVEVALTNALQDINFDTVLGIGGYEYLKEFLLQKLREDFGDEIESVNIHSLFTQVIG